MKQELISKLCCGFDKADLKLTVLSRDVNEHILEGILECVECKRVFPIISGIPVMSPDEYREPALEAPVLQRYLQG